jgi:hypothetical protein
LKPKMRSPISQPLLHSRAMAVRSAKDARFMEVCFLSTKTERFWFRLSRVRASRPR